MNSKNPEDVTFQVTVGQLTLSSKLPEQDIRVTVAVDGVSKITCSGEPSEDGLTISWNHPFLYTSPPSATAEVAICILPEELSTEWDKQLLGDKMVTDVASLLGSTDGWQCNVPGLLVNSATLSITSQLSDVLITENGHDCVSSLTRYTQKLHNFGKQFKNVACASTNIEASLAALDLCPLGHADHTTILNEVATTFCVQYHQGGNISDLNRAIEIQKTRLALCPPGHKEHISALAELAISLWHHYCIQENKEDLNRLIDMQQRWLDLCPPDHPDHSRALGTFAVSLWERYYVQGDIRDLDRAIEMEEKKLELTSEDHQDYSIALTNLAASIMARFRKQGSLADLDRAIDLKEKCLELASPNHWDYGLDLQNLAIPLLDRYKKLKNHSDLIRAIKLFKEALNTYPIHHSSYAFTAGLLAMAILHFKSSDGDQSLFSLDEAFEAYKLLKNCGPAVSLNLLEATKSWVKDAEEYNHSSVLEAYQTSLITLDHFTSFNSSLDSRHETMQARVTDAANNAFSCAIRHGDFQMAVELLEQGRGILWNQLARFEMVSMGLLESQGNQGRELGSKFARLSAGLRKHADGSGNKGMGPYWRIQEEWQAVVDKIRRLQGFSRFLLPPHFEDLQQAAVQGPVIIANASKYGCDALIVLCTAPPVHVSLPCSFADVAQLCLQLSELTQDVHAYGENRESWVKQTLRDLWSSVVGPIASVLQNDVQLPSGSRVWWCPTSRFTVLPFHAAGPYRKGQKNFMDIYISSYAPSLSGLIRTRERIRLQKEARDASGLADMVSFAAVGQARPSANAKLGELIEVEHEIRRIRDETDMSPNVTFNAVTGSAATIEGVVKAFRDYRWVHVACHGAQHAEKPFESWFAMGDGKLTLMRIIQERYTNSEFAFLSACHTAVGDASTPDEVLHLAAGMQFAGFNGVIGTLWRVDDAVAHQVVTRFYKEMFKFPEIGFEHAAAALNSAAMETADEVSLEKRIVFVHIGI